MVLDLHVVRSMDRGEGDRIVMLVDDEHTRMVCVDAISHEGHGAILASREEEVLRVLEREVVDIFVVELPGPAGDDRMALLSDVRQRALQPLPEIMAVSQPEAIELRRRARDAGVIDFLSKPVEPVEVACRVQLILAHRRSRALTGLREKVKLKHIRCCSIVDSVAEGIGMINADGRVEFVNPKAAEMLGLTVDEVLGHPASDFVADEHGRRILREKLKRVRQGFPERTELPIQRKDGTTLWVLASGTPLYEQGRYIGAVVAFLDISLRRKAEEDLGLSEQRLQLATAAGGVGLWDWNIKADTAYLSPEYLRMIGGGTETEIGSARAWFEHLVHPDDQVSVMRTLDEHLERKTPQSIIEYRARHSSGDFIWLRGIGRVLDRDQTGAPLRMTGAVVDISELKHTEELLREALVLRNNVLAIVSHDLKNPLSAIHLSATLLTERPRERDRRKSRRQLEVILRSAEFMRHLIDTLLTAATIEEGTFTLNYATEELEPLVDDLFQQLEPLAARKSIHLVRNPLTDLPPICCDGTRLRQVLANLIGNALNFVPANGTVRLRVWVAAADVHFEIADNGRGISEQALAHLFERYWKNDSRGTGLGLFISKSIVDAHHGQMFVESNIGVGTTFRFTIPVKPQVEQPLETVD